MSTTAQVDTGCGGFQSTLVWNTNELLLLWVIFHSISAITLRREDLNPRPPAYEAGELPTALLHDIFENGR